MEFQGVQFTDAQMGVINADLALIDQLNAEMRGLQAQIEGWVGGVMKGNENIAACTTYWGAGTQKESQCIGPYQDSNNYYTDQINHQNWTVIPQKQSQIEIAKKNYNDDLAAIQNQIKLGIQASVANSTASAQAAQNKVSIQQNDPLLLAKKLELTAKLDAQKKAAQVKFVGFVVVAIVVVLIGWYVIKKLL